MTPILQSRLPLAPWMDLSTSRLPGINPVDSDDWLTVDDAFYGQMQRRDDLIAQIPQVVLGQLPAGLPAAQELYDLILSRLAMQPGYQVGSASVVRPDGVEVPLDRAQPLKTLGRLVQEDLCLLEKHGDEHVLTGACLCFPSSWSLAEKLGRPLIGIHRTVRVYDEALAKRVQRMFDMIRPDKPLWRMNALNYVDPELHQPGVEGAPRKDRTNGQFMRVERQTMLRLPATNAVLFAIHTYVVRLETLTEAERAELESARL